MIALASPSKREARDVLDEPVSASRLTLFHSCRLKFFFRYVQRLVKPVSPALFVGQAVHHALQAWSNRRWKSQPCSDNDLWEAFDAQWTTAQGEMDEPIAWDDEEEQTQRGKAWTLVEHYLATTPIPTDEKPLAVEVGVEADLSDMGLPTLCGVIDLVRPGGVIVDFKTTATTPDGAMALHRHDLQLAAYSLLYREATGENETGIELHHLVKTKVPKLVVTRADPINQDQAARFLRSMVSYVEGVKREDWVPSPGIQCQACEYVGDCMKWSGGVE